MVWPEENAYEPPSAEGRTLHAGHSAAVLAPGHAAAKSGGHTWAVGRMWGRHMSALHVAKTLPEDPQAASARLACEWWPGLLTMRQLGYAHRKGREPVENCWSSFASGLPRGMIMRLQGMQQCMQACCTGPTTEEREGFAEALYCSSSESSGRAMNNQPGRLVPEWHIQVS